MRKINFSKINKFVQKLFIKIGMKKKMLKKSHTVCVKLH